MFKPTDCRQTFYHSANYSLKTHQDKIHISSFIFALFKFSITNAQSTKKQIHLSPQPTPYPSNTHTDTHTRTAQIPHFNRCTINKHVTEIHTSKNINFISNIHELFHPCLHIANCSLCSVVSKNRQQYNFTDNSF